MGYQKILSTKFNMSLGFIPVIISILLSEIMTQDISVYIGAGVGLLFSLYAWWNKGTHIPQIILYCTTGMLLLLSVTTLFVRDYCPHSLFPFTLEISAVIPPLIIFLNRKRFLNYHEEQTKQCCKQLFAQGAEAAIVSARVVLIFSMLHFLVIIVTMLIWHPLGNTARFILYDIMPPAVFILCILFNQFGIHYFNKVMRHTVFVPVVNKKGDVIGKAMAADAINKKHDYINPVIRIAVAAHGMLFLMQRPKCVSLESEKTDLPMESYLLYGETLVEGAQRLLQHKLPGAPLSELHFNFMYHFENESTNRLIYLFTLDLSNDSVLNTSALKGGKLWTFRQIEHNLGRNFFCQCFENEYEQLKSIICIREKYKES